MATTQEMNDLMREVNAANERGDRKAAIAANEKLTRMLKLDEEM